MEGLRKQALSDFSKVNFAPPTPKANDELITLQSDDAGGGGGGACFFRREYLPLSDILERFEGGQDSLPKFRLVTLHIIHPARGGAWEPPTLKAAEADIVRLWRLFGLEPTALQLLCQGIRGLNQFPPDGLDATADVLHFMFSSYTYCVIWAFRPGDGTTSGVVVTRPDTSAKTTHVENWWEALQSQVAIARHPLCLFVVSAMEVAKRTFRGSMKSQSQINHLESLTGFNPWVPGDGVRSAPMTLEVLSLASRNMGGVMVSLEDYARQVRLLRQASAHVSRSGIITGFASDSSEAADIAAAINTLEQQMNAWEIRVDYLRERAKNQLTVIFNLMTRYDAASSIAIAKSAKKDSTSMKAIAIMTMVFLPGTFFAALFAVPSLRWDASPVIQSNHWVYWAFSVPSTLVVMLVWVWVSRETPAPAPGARAEDPLRKAAGGINPFLLLDRKHREGGSPSPISLTALRKRVLRWNNGEWEGEGSEDVRV